MEPVVSAPVADATPAAAPTSAPAGRPLLPAPLLPATASTAIIDPLAVAAPAAGPSPAALPPITPPGSTPAPAETTPNAASPEANPAVVAVAEKEGEASEFGNIPPPALLEAVAAVSWLVAENATPSVLVRLVLTASVAEFFNFRLGPSASRIKLFTLTPVG